MDNAFNFQDEETKALKEEEQDLEEDQEEEEEALSLCDLPLNPDEAKHRSKSQENSRRPSSDQSDYFEFFNDFSSGDPMSHAEDIIFCGKLVPYKKNPPLFDDQILRSFSDDDSVNFSRRYCESLPELDPTRSNSISSSTRLTRSSRSLDSKKLRRNSSLVMKSEASDARRSFWKSSAKPELSRGLSLSKPRWYAWMFSLSLKSPVPEMDLRDIKNRQIRRNKQCPLPAAEGGGRLPADRSHSWGVDLINVLSCKSHASVAVTHSIGGYDLNRTHVTIT